MRTRTVHVAAALWIACVAGSPIFSQDNPLGKPKANPLGKKPVDPLVGSYEGEDLTIVLRAGSGGYEGEIRRGGDSYPLSAKKQDDGGLKGTFEAAGSSFEFTAKVENGTIELVTGGATYSAKKKSPAVTNPLSPDRSGKKTIAPPEKVKTFQHPVGFHFQHPERWKIQGSPNGIMILPHDVVNDAQGNPLELFLISGDSAEGIARPDDPRVGQYFDQLLAMTFAGATRTGKTDKLDCLFGPGAIFHYQASSPDGTKLKIDVYCAIHKGMGIYLAHASRDDLIEKRRAAARRMFSSFGWSKGKTDPKVVGHWTREETESSGVDIRGSVGATSHLQYVFAKDGTCYYGSSTRMFGTVTGANGVVSIDDPGGGGNVSRGNWFVDGNGKLWILWSDGGVSQFGYRVFPHQGNEAIKLTAENGKHKYFTRRR